MTGGIPVERADGKPLEVRNRVTLCNCGHSCNKPCAMVHIVKTRSKTLQSKSKSDEIVKEESLVLLPLLAFFAVAAIILAADRASCRLSLSVYMHFRMETSWTFLLMGLLHSFSPWHCPNG